MAISAFREEGYNFRSTKSEKAAVMRRDERITGVGGGPGGGESAGTKYCSPGGLQRKWKQRPLLWSIAKCLPGNCIFNPLSKAIWACNVDQRPAANRKSWKMDAGYMWARHTHQPTQLCSRVETCAQILLMRTPAIVQRTADATFSHKTRTASENSYKWLRFKKIKNSIQQQMFDRKISRAPSASWKAITESQEVLHFGVWEAERDRKRGEEGQRESCHCTRMSFQCETVALPAKTLNYLRVPSHSAMNMRACTFAHIQCLCITK